MFWGSLGIGNYWRKQTIVFWIWNCFVLKFDASRLAEFMDFGGDAVVNTRWVITRRHYTCRNPSMDKQTHINSIPLRYSSIAASCLPIDLSIGIARRPLGNECVIIRWWQRTSTPHSNHQRIDIFGSGFSFVAKISTKVRVIGGSVSKTAIKWSFIIGCAFKNSDGRRWIRKSLKTNNNKNKNVIKSFGAPHHNRR